MPISLNPIIATIASRPLRRRHLPAPPTPPESKRRRKDEETAIHAPINNPATLIRVLHSQFIHSVPVLRLQLSDIYAAFQERSILIPPINRHRSQSVVESSHHTTVSNSVKRCLLLWWWHGQYLCALLLPLKGNTTIPMEMKQLGIPRKDTTSLNWGGYCKWNCSPWSISQ